jgi:hypothetical protein
MTTLSTNYLTMMDWAKRLDPDGKTADIVEMLSQVNSVVDDMLVKEGNLPTGEQTTIRTGLPTAYYRMINSGVPDSKSTTAQVVENAAILVARSQIDVDEAELNGNTASYRLSESEAFVQAMGIAQATTFIYGSAANPEQYVGLANRYNDLGAANGENIIDAGGTSADDNTSVYLVGWGAKGVFGVFPKGSKAGLTHEDLGIQDAFDSSDNRFRAYMDEYKWKNGLVVKDWRQCVRIANIDVSDLVGITGTQALTASTNILNLMSRAIDHIWNPSSAKLVFYVNRTVASHLRVMALNKSQNAVTVEPALNQFGKTIHEMRFLGIPVRLNDVQINTEARVV